MKRLFKLLLITTIIAALTLSMTGCYVSYRPMSRSDRAEFEREMEDFGEEMGDWGEAFGEDMAEWGENFGEDMADWGEDFGEDMGDWGEDFGEDMEDWAERYDDDERYVHRWSPFGVKVRYKNSGDLHEDLDDLGDALGDNFEDLGDNLSDFFDDLD